MPVRRVDSILSVSNQDMNQRNTNLDLLKVLAAFTVVWLHVSATVVGTKPDIHSVTWWIGSVANALSRWCVPVFVMISGSLLLSAPSNLSPMDFYKKRAVRILPSILFWTLVYITFRWLLSEKFTLKIAAESIVQGTPYHHLWYLYMTIGLYFVTPFLHSLVSGSPLSALRLLIVGSFTISATEYIFGGKSATFLPRFLPFIGYFLVGHYLSVYPHELKIKASYLVVIAIVCGAIIAAGTGALLPALGSRAWGIMYSYLNPVVIVMSVCIFLFFARATFSMSTLYGLTQRIAPITLGIYVIHPLWLWGLAKFGITAFWSHPLVGIPLTTFLAFVLSALTAELLAGIPVLRRTVS
jgi:surface polysaccharide O-acyltransferase-like enzyme